MKTVIEVNGKVHELDVPPDEILLDTLRALGYKGVKRGCETGTCGTCAVLLDGVPHYSCMLLTAAMDGHKVTTIEGLGTPSNPHPIVQAMAEEGGVQCGYCTPGIVLSAKALLDENPHPTEAEVREALDGHLCRCTGYVKKVKAVLKAADMMHRQGGQQ